MGRSRKARRKRRRPTRTLRTIAALGGAGALGLLGLALVGRREQRRRAPRRPPSPPLAEVRTSWLAGPAGDLHVTEAGDGGLPIVLLHGLGGTADHWRPVLARLGHARHAIALDFRGHGRSDPSTSSSYDLESLVADVKAVVDGLGLLRVVLAGHSLGAAVAARFTATHPGRAVGLVLVDSNGDLSRLPAEETSRLLDSVAKDPQGEISWSFRQLLAEAAPETAERVLADVGGTDEQALVGCLTHSLRHSPVPDLDTFGGAKLLLASPLNDLPGAVQRLRPKLPLAVLRPASHWLMLDRPDEVSEILDAFLASLDPLPS